MNPRTNPVALNWPCAQTVPPVATGEIHVFAWDLTIPPQPRDWQRLSKDEADRAGRFMFPRDRDHYVRAHSTMRALLAAYANLPPAELSFLSGPYGKPWIALPAAISGDSQRPESSPPLQFNLTHSGGIAALAIAREHSVGIDLERVRPIASEIAENHFSPSERKTLENLPPAQWLDGFYRCWTAKEALLKGLGLGLNLALDSFDVEADPQRPAALLAWRPPADLDPGWRLLALDPAPGFTGTLAVREDAGRFTADHLQCFSLPSDFH